MFPVKIINVCGFGNTGCTAQADILSEYEGFYPILDDTARNRSVLNAPYQEFGLLKSIYSLGGLYIARIHGGHVDISRDDLRRSLKGDISLSNRGLSRTELIHLGKRKLLVDRYGDPYLEVVDEVVNTIPEDYINLSDSDLLHVLRDAMMIFQIGMENIISSDLGSCGANSPNNRICLGIKNDPPAAYPILAYLLHNGLSSAIIRDPRDTSFDYSHGANSFGEDISSVIKHCHFYNRQIMSCQSQLEKHRSKLHGIFFVHEFESLISSSAHREKYVLAMLGSRNRVSEYFDEEKSKENVGVYKSMKKDHIKIVEEICMTCYTSFLSFLRSSGFLFE